MQSPPHLKQHLNWSARSCPKHFLVLWCGLHIVTASKQICVRQAADSAAASRWRDLAMSIYCCLTVYLLAPVYAEQLLLLLNALSWLHSYSDPSCFAGRLTVLMMNHMLSQTHLRKGVRLKPGRSPRRRACSRGVGALKTRVQMRSKSRLARASLVTALQPWSTNLQVGFHSMLTGKARCSGSEDDPADMEACFVESSYKEHIPQAGKCSCKCTVHLQSACAVAGYTFQPKEGKQAGPACVKFRLGVCQVTVSEAQAIVVVKWKGTLQMSNSTSIVLCMQHS